MPPLVLPYLVCIGICGKCEERPNAALFGCGGVDVLLPSFVAAVGDFSPYKAAAGLGCRYHGRGCSKAANARCLSLT